MRTRAAEVCTAVTAGSEHCLVRAESVQCAVLHVQRHDANTLAIFHDQIKREVFDEEVGVVTEGLAVERVEESVASTVCRSRAAVGLSTLAVLGTGHRTRAGRSCPRPSLRRAHRSARASRGVKAAKRNGRLDDLTSMTVLGASRHM